MALAPQPAAGPAEMTCFVLYTPRNAAAVARAAGFGAVSAPAGWGARAIERAYRLPVARDPHQTVAVVDAFDTPRLESYLNTYRRQYGLPPCTTANGCFRKVNGAGRAGPLPFNGTFSGWDLETTLDVDMVSAACPRCHILVVEANSPSLADIAAAENTAVRLGAAVVSNSFGGRENGFILTFARAFEHPGHAIVASSGDLGYTAAGFPADLAAVTAVGGTALATAPGRRGYSEKVWNTPLGGAGSSGCSAYVGKPRWQHDTHCPGRTVADVAAVAKSIALYNKDWGGWIDVAGTSASAPIVAGVFGLAANAAAIRPGYEYAHARAFFDVTQGNNDYFFQGGGSSCGGDYMCVAKKGYDAPTGLGTPDGIGAL
jgi:subtilase family serine protease